MQLKMCWGDGEDFFLNYFLYKKMGNEYLICGYNIDLLVKIICIAFFTINIVSKQLCTKLYNALML